MKRQSQRITDIKLMLIIIVVAVIPLLVRVQVIPYDTSNIDWYASEILHHPDLYTYYKSLVLIITATIMAIWIVKDILLNKKNINIKELYSAYFYFITILVSFVLSYSMYYSITGYIDRMENVFVLLSYVIVFIFTATYAFSESSLKKLTYAWVISIFILSLIGFTQLFGFDIFRSDFGLSLIVPGDLLPHVNDVGFTLWKDTLIYQTLAHYNYVSFYCGLSFPYFLSILISSKDTKKRILYIVLLIITVVNLIGSQARNGFIGVMLGSLIVLVLYGRSVLLNKKVILSALTGLTLLILVIVFTDTTLEQRFTSIITESSNPIDYPLNSIITAENTVIIDHDKSYVRIAGTTTEADKVQYTFFDINDKRIKFVQDEFTLNLISDGDSNTDYSHLSMRIMVYQGKSVLNVTIDNQDWPFIFDNNNFYYLNPYGNEVILEETRSIGFEGIEQWGSKRGYIWSRSLPLIAERPLFGYGPSTFPLIFPQNDYVGKLNAYNNLNIVVDKPHNLFLSYAINTGLLSLIAFLIIVIISYIKTIKAVASKSNNTPYIIGTIGSITGYITSGFFNDTVLHVTPLFWVLIGINYALTTVNVTSKK